MNDRVIINEEDIYSFNSYNEAINFLHFYILDRRSEVILEMMSDIRKRIIKLEMNSVIEYLV